MGFPLVLSNHLIKVNVVIVDVRRKLAKLLRFYGADVGINVIIPPVFRQARFMSIKTRGEIAK